MSTETGSPVENGGSVAEYVCMYYEHQYDRMAKLEDQALTITNIVMTLSIVAFTFGFDGAQGVTAITGIGLPFVMVIANLFAIRYIGRSQSWLLTHRLRAKRVLEVYAKDLYQLDRTTSAPHKHWVLGRWRIQRLLHVLLVVAALIPSAVYLEKLL